MMIKDSLEDIVKRENIYMLFDTESPILFWRTSDSDFEEGLEALLQGHV